MRHGSSNRRTRSNRGGNGGGRKAPNKNRVFDSSGPEVRIRGTAHQISEKYLVLAKDAASSGDPILAQSYMQHAEHYQRLINEWAEQSAVNVQASAPQEQEEVGENSSDVVAEVAVKKEEKSPVLEDA